MTRMGQLAVIVALVVFYVTGASADKLYPRCGGEILSQSVAAGKTRQLHAISDESSRLFIKCIAVEVVPENLADCDDATSTAQNELPFRVFVRTAGQKEDGTTVEMEYDVRDTIGGSVNQLTISLPVRSTYKLFVSNTDKNKKCVLKTRAIFEYETQHQTTIERQEPLPVLVSADPRTIYADKRSNTYFVFRHADDSIDFDEDSVRLIEAGNKCSDATQRSKIVGRLALETDEDVITKHTAKYKHPALHSVWKYFFDSSGNYNLCFKHKDVTFEEVAELTVFGGNPSYFELTHGTGKQGQVFLNTPTTMRFNGAKLKAQDFAKFVVDDTTCEDGDPAGGAGLANHLTVNEVGGTATSWEFVLKNGGVFKVCYKRHEHAWVEVPNIDDLPDQVVQHHTQAPPVPTPTHASGGGDCDMAPARHNQPTYPTYLKLTLDSSEARKNFRRDLSMWLCIPRSTLQIVYATKDKDNHGVLWVDIVCKDDDIHEGCDGIERKNYLLLHKKKAKGSFGIVSIQEEKATGLTSFEAVHLHDDSPKNHAIVIVIVLLLILGIVAILSRTYLKTQAIKVQHHFVQFGTHDDDEDEDEDDLEAGNRPIEDSSSKGQRVFQASPAS